MVWNTEDTNSLKNYHILCLIKKVELATAVSIIDVDISLAVFTDCCATMKHFIRQIGERGNKQITPKPQEKKPNQQTPKDCQRGVPAASRHTRKEHPFGGPQSQWQHHLTQSEIAGIEILCSLYYSVLVRTQGKVLFPTQRKTFRFVKVWIYPLYTEALTGVAEFVALVTVSRNQQVPLNDESDQLRTAVPKVKVSFH